MLNPNLNAAAAEKFQPFMEKILGGYQDNIHSIAITGSALTTDFDPEKSDVNSIFVLHKMDLKFLETLAHLGKKFRKKNVAAPLIMTPAYINNSLDVFPLEFLNIKLLHHILYGEDLFMGLEIKLSDLRLQCERELKVRLIGLRQGYIATLGDRKTLMEMFFSSISGYMPLFKAVIFLLGQKPPPENETILAILEEASGIDTTVFRNVLKLKKQTQTLSIEQINTLFAGYYGATEKLGDFIDAIGD